MVEPAFVVPPAPRAYPFSHELTTDMARISRAIAIAVLALPFGVAVPADALTFTPTSINVPGTNFGYPSGLGVGDFNEDGQADIAVAMMTGDLSILLGDRPNGTHVQAPGSPRALGTGMIFGGLKATDINGDGHLDLVFLRIEVRGVATANVLLGDGHGGFGALITTTLAGDPETMALGDVTGDGKLDLVLALDSAGATSADRSTLAVVPGNGDGTFRSALPGGASLGGRYPGGIALADFDGDGKLDVAVTDWGVAVGIVAVLRGDGAGGFTSVPGSPYDIGSGGYTLSAGDVNGDGELDLVSSVLPTDPSDPASRDDRTKTVGVLLGNGDGSFRPGPTGSFVTPRTINPVSAFVLPLGDLDGDGRLDAVMPLDESNAVWPLFGDGTGRFLSPTATPLLGGPNMTAGAIADLNGDDRPDILAVSISSPSRLFLYTNDGEQAIAVDATALDLGTRQVGEPAARRTVTVSNPGDYGLRVRTLTVTGDDAADFTASGCLDRPIPAGQRCDVSVAFAPRAAGARAASLKIDSDASGASPRTISLSGTATPAPYPPETGGSGGSGAGGNDNGTGASGGTGGGAIGGGARGDGGSTTGGGSRPTGLRVTVRPAKARLAPGRRRRLMVTIGNAARTTAKNVTLCPRVSAKPLTAGRCLRMGTIGAGRSVRRPVVITLARTARPGRRYTLVLTAKGSGAITGTARVLVTARR